MSRAKQVLHAISEARRVKGEPKIYTICKGKLRSTLAPEEFTGTLEELVSQFKPQLEDGAKEFPKSRPVLTNPEKIGQLVSSLNHYEINKSEDGIGTYRYSLKSNKPIIYD